MPGNRSERGALGEDVPGERGAHRGPLPDGFDPIARGAQLVDPSGQPVAGQLLAGLSRGQAIGPTSAEQAEQMPPLENALHNLRGQLEALQKQGAREAAASGRVQAEVQGMVEEVVAEKRLVRAWLGRWL